MTNRMFMVGALLMAVGCDATVPSAQQGSLSAGEAAQRFGVESYVIEDRGDSLLVRLLGKEGELGHVTVANRGELSRDVELSTTADGTQRTVLTAEQALPIVVGMNDGSMLAAVLADASLAAPLAAHQVEVLRNVQTGITTQILSPDQVATCNTVCTLTSGCSTGSNPTLYIKPGQSQAEVYADSAQGAADCAAYGCISGGSCQRWYSQWGYGYSCFISLTYASFTADCPRASCGFGRVDHVSAYRTCLDPGTGCSLSTSITCDYTCGDGVCEPLDNENSNNCHSDCGWTE